MTTPAPTEPMSAAQSAALADFARTCKTAARSVSLYPATHPAIQGALSRVVDASRRIAGEGQVSIAVLPNQLVIEGRAPSKPDAAIGEFAELLHHRLVGELRIDRDADAGAWRTLLLLLSQTTEELMSQGGISKALAATGQTYFEIREIDYAEVLRERAGVDGAAWERIIEFCLQGNTEGSIDDRALEAVIDALGDAEQFRELLERIQTAPESEANIGARAAALLTLIRKAFQLLQKHGEVDTGPLLQTVTDAAAHMTPDMMLSLLQQVRQPADVGEQPLADAIIGRMSDDNVASFVAGSVVAERGATERLAVAFEALAPDTDRKTQVLELAKKTAEQTPLGSEPGFGSLWQGAAEMLLSYSDKPFVSEDYGRELSGARAQALEVERVSDDPPERVQAWLLSVTDRAVRELDLTMIHDLLRIEDNPETWHPIASVAADEIERLTLAGDPARAHTLLTALTTERGEEGRPPLHAAAESVLSSLAAGNIVQHIVVHLRKVDGPDVEPLTRLCQTIGPSVVRPLALALAAEQNNRAIRHLRELLLGFGLAGRHSVEQLKNSPNPAVRRTAIDLLRVFGGSEALPELASMLDDADPQVQRESIRAIVQIGSEQAFAVLEQALVGGNASRHTILQQLISLRDEKAIPLLCYVLNHAAPRGALVAVHTQIIEALGSLPAHAEATRTLQTVLHRGEWWAPFRTAALRQAAAGSLRRLGSPEALTILQEAAAHGSRGVRNAARRHLRAAGRDVS